MPNDSSPCVGAIMVDNGKRMRQPRQKRDGMDTEAMDADVAKALEETYNRIDDANHRITKVMSLSCRFDIAKSIMECEPSRNDISYTNKPIWIIRTDSVITELIRLSESVKQYMICLPNNKDFGEPDYSVNSS